MFKNCHKYTITPYQQTLNVRCPQCGEKKKTKIKITTTSNYSHLVRGFGSSDKQ